MNDVHPLNKFERTNIIDHFFTHPKFKQANSYQYQSDVQDRVIAIDFAYTRTNQLRLSVFVKGKQLDQVFRNLDDVFDGWDGYYSFDIPSAGDLRGIENIRQGVNRMFDQLMNILNTGEIFWFVIKDVDHYYELKNI